MLITFPHCVEDNQAVLNCYIERGHVLYWEDVHANYRLYDQVCYPAFDYGLFSTTFH